MLRENNIGWHRHNALSEPYKILYQLQPGNRHGKAFRENFEVNTQSQCILMNRDRSLDLGRGLAILFVYLGHSILYHPIKMVDMYEWCYWLGAFIDSFNMPIFFLISGYLFFKTEKSTKELYKGKTLRLLIPYLTTMAIIVGMKSLLPSSMSYNTSAQNGTISMIIDTLVYAGDRWFVYVLFIIYPALIPIRNLLKNKWMSIGLMVVLMLVYFLNMVPNAFETTSIFALNKVCYFTIFFLLGYTLADYYRKFKQWATTYRWLVYAVFIIVNILLLKPCRNIPLLYQFILSLTGSAAVMTVAFQLEKSLERNKIVQYIEYAGKYSLQFYLLTFCYPIIRTVLISVLHVSNAVVILVSVFFLQLIAITIIVEITRRIKWLKIPFGY